jgi:uncharacterized protein
MVIPSSSHSQSSRVDVVDALRGFTILSIMLLHNIEHFDLYFFPEFLPGWIKSLDSKIWDSLFFLFGGKSYAIFALLFGFTFFIQFNNWEKKGKDFRARFAWRLVLLLIFGIINTMFYSGDILVLYAVLGLTLIPVSKWSNNAVLITAAVLMAQPFELFKIFSIYTNSSYIVPPNSSDYYYGQSGAYLTGESFFNLVMGNLLNGRFASLFWSWENGRFFQTVSLFMIGMVLGRTGKFLPSELNSKFWKRTLMLSAILFVPLYYLRINIHGIISSEVMAGRFDIIVSSWSNLAFMILLVSLFVTAYQINFFHRILYILNPLGRMSLTNYVMQSVIGSLIYYGYGLGLYQFTGATYSVAIGLLLCTLQIFFCRWWMKSHAQGPLETIWHHATWI